MLSWLQNRKGKNFVCGKKSAIYMQIALNTEQWTMCKFIIFIYIWFRKVPLFLIFFDVILMHPAVWLHSSYCFFLFQICNELTYFFKNLNLN